MDNVIELCGKVSPIISLSPTRLDWCIRVRVIRMWSVRSSVVGGNGKKIQAVVPNQCVNRLVGVLHEDGVYLIAFFYVQDNHTPCMITLNPYKIVFCSLTKVFSSESLVIPHYSLTLLSSDKIKNYKNGLNYLFDVIGLVTNVHYEYADHYLGEGMCAVRVELSDKRGVYQCYLCGSFVHQFRAMVSECCNELPVLVLQFVKIDVKEGYVCVESVTDVTRMLLNPNMYEVSQFKKDFAYLNSVCDFGRNGQSTNGTISRELQFNKVYPHKTVNEFVHTLEDGLFVICAKIVGLFQVDQWWYPVCHCGAFLSISDGSYYCDKCHLCVFSSTSKCKLQIAIQDQTSAALLPMFDYLVKEIGCINNNGLDFALSVNGAAILNKRIVLLIVKKTQRVDEMSNHVVEVVHITDEMGLIKQFHSDGRYFTPTKCVYKPPFGASSSRVCDAGKLSAATATAYSIVAEKELANKDGSKDEVNCLVGASKEKNQGVTFESQGGTFFTSISGEGSSTCGN
ncbi:replication protein A 70 kDa DNA-binding subunit C-like [Trifolium pratense]|uniref:replication protein A 70 kDa DNA-binding subunit C-like n=1 Tax=Trifolium pratense TaxID=57577 RepID=UPI001E68FE4A|nr:replication protein A 70 kDa DNA-binding subunit C-like [Trifolium pratense]